MTIKEIIDGLKFTVDMFLFDPTTGESYKEPRNDMDKTTIDACNGAIELLEQTRWIPCSERLPKENEYIGDVCKYYLIQDEYGDMHVAHLSNVGWIPMDAFKAIGNEIIAWRELPESYKPEKDVNCTDLCKSCNTKGCIFQSGIVRTHCDFYKAESEE